MIDLPPPEKLTLSQKDGWKYLQQKDLNCFLTGYAGTGKTFLLKEWLRKQYGRGVSIMASTGMAAVNIEGCTFHSFFGVGIGKGEDMQIVHSAAHNGRQIQLISKTKVIVIDEISMLSGRMLNIASMICQLIKANLEPWGGIKVVTCGDFGQLPPIPEEYQDGLDWAFRSPTWIQSKFKPIFLKDPIRTTDSSFLNVLDKVRVGLVDDEVKDFIYSKEIQPGLADEFEGTRIFSTRKKVDEYNQKKLDEINEPEVSYDTKYRGDSSYFERLKNSLPISEIVTIKKGAIVMIRVNSPDSGYINGTLAKVVETEDNYAVCLKLENLVTGEPIMLPRHDFEWRDQWNRVRASARNFPITLAWACTIHKSQGASISRLLVDMGYLWEYGQAYVALSRSSDPSNLRILNPNVSGIKAAPEVIDFYDSISDKT